MKKKKPSVLIKKTNSGNARFMAGVKGFGTITLAGTNEFVTQAVSGSEGVLKMLFEKHYRQREAAGDSHETIENEFNAALTKAAKKAGIKPRP